MSKVEVLSVSRAQEQATANGDAQGVVQALGGDVVLFDLPPPLIYRGEQARDIEIVKGWLATWRDGVTVHLADPQVMVEGDLAVVFGLSRMTGTKTDGTKVDSWSGEPLF